MEVGRLSSAGGWQVVALAAASAIKGGAEAPQATQEAVACVVGSSAAVRTGSFGRAGNEVDTGAGAASHAVEAPSGWHEDSDSGGSQRGDGSGSGGGDCAAADGFWGTPIKGEGAATGPHRQPQQGEGGGTVRRKFDEISRLISGGGTGAGAEQHQHLEAAGGPPRDVAPGSALAGGSGELAAAAAAADDAAAGGFFAAASAAAAAAGDFLIGTGGAAEEDGARDVGTGPPSARVSLRGSRNIDQVGVAVVYVKWRKHCRKPGCLQHSRMGYQRWTGRSGHMSQSTACKHRRCSLRRRRLVRHASTHVKTMQPSCLTRACSVHADNLCRSS